MTEDQKEIEENVVFHLYTYYRSSCSARLRIALAFKNLTYKSTFINLISNSHLDARYTSVNPSQSLPTLEIKMEGHTVKISQSVAALEYLDEAFPSTYQLLPPASSPQLRATVRTLVGIVASDIQPPTNLRILNRVRRLAAAAGEDPDETARSWAKELMTHGLLAYEAVCRDVAGKYSVGDDISMADCCLVPAVWGAERFGVDMLEMPTIKRVYEELSQREEVMAGHWKNQKDTPEDLRK